MTEPKQTKTSTNYKTEEHRNQFLSIPFKLIQFPFSSQTLCTTKHNRTPNNYHDTAQLNNLVSSNPNKNQKPQNHK